ncbi:uncharacterized protein LOC124682076 isoform X2 [Lolium rigidum]|uniref:uncharacterized protein LOC124682076 isoform X2 n=1 Tax=Lolium rigidum TaxID=89674 RepID=UPI001F5E0CE9|nr:uncharacterized protein LOC124682076 isoform X2 [Lolium rigidum]
MRVMNHRWWKYLNIDGDNAELKAPMGLLDNRHRPSWRAGGGRWSRNVGHTPSYTPSPPPGCFLKHSCFILILIASAYGFVGKSSSAMAEGWRREVEQERRSHSILHAEAPSWYRKKRPGHARKQRAGRSMKLSGHATGVVFLTSCAAWEKMSALLYCKLLMAGLWCTGSLRRFRVSLMLYSGRGRPKSYLGSLLRMSLLFGAHHKKRVAATAELAWNICPVQLQDGALSFQLLFLVFVIKLTTLLGQYLVLDFLPMPIDYSPLIECKCFLEYRMILT